MSGLFGAFKTNNEAEKTGRWFNFTTANEDGTLPGFKLARMSKSNPVYQTAMEATAKELRREIELDILTEDAADPIFRKVFIDTILVEWRHVQDANNQVIPFSKENAEALFEELPDLYAVLVEEARKLANFRAKAVDAVTEK